MTRFSCSSCSSSVVPSQCGGQGSARVRAMQRRQQLLPSSGADDLPRAQGPLPFPPVALPVLRARPLSPTYGPP